MQDPYLTLKRLFFYLQLAQIEKEICEGLSFKNDEDKEKYDVILNKFKTFYAPKVNITCERYKFFTRSQEEGEWIDRYATALHSLARTWKFGDIRDLLIRDRIVLGVKNPRLSKRLLAAGDPDLQKTLEMYRAEEGFLAQTHGMSANVYAKTVSKVSFMECQEDESDEDSGATLVAAVNRQRQRSSSGVKKCYRCGRNHPARRCPAWGKTCGKCRRSIHFAERCKTKIVNALSVSEESVFNIDVHGNTDTEGTPAQLPDNELNCRQSIYTRDAHNRGKISVCLESSLDHQWYICCI